MRAFKIPRWLAVEKERVKRFKMRENMRQGPLIKRLKSFDRAETYNAVLTVLRFQGEN